MPTTALGPLTARPLFPSARRDPSRMTRALREHFVANADNVDARGRSRCLHWCGHVVCVLFRSQRVRRHSSGGQHNLDATIPLIAEGLVETGTILKRRTVRDDKAGVDFALFDPAKQLERIAIDVRLPRADG